MKSRSRILAISLIILLSIGVFTVAGFVQAAESDQGNQGDQKAIMEGAQRMMDGSKTVMNIMTKKGMTDAELTSAEKKMTEGYDMVVKGNSMMTGNTMAEGKEMVTRGAKMMLDANKAMAAAVEKKGMTQECSNHFGTCSLGEQEINYGLHSGMRGGNQ